MEKLEEMVINTIVSGRLHVFVRVWRDEAPLQNGKVWRIYTARRATGLLVLKNSIA